MLARSFKKFVIAMLLASFATQVMAAAQLSCNMANTVGAMSVLEPAQSVAMDHSMHHGMSGTDMTGPETDTDTDTIDNCCGDGLCLAGACFVSFVSTQAMAAVVLKTTTQFHIKVPAFYQIIDNPLYRPPISS
jgi:hypothetical protein